MEDLRATPAKVLPLYSYRPTSVSTVQAQQVKTVWQVQARDRTLCLKRLRQDPDRAAFSVGAQCYLAEQGGPVARVIPSITGNAWVVVDGQVFVLYEWLDGQTFSLASERGLEAAVTALARFHLSSRGYCPPPGSRISTKLGRWPAHYREMRRRLEEWQGTAEAGPTDLLFAAYLAGVGVALANAKEAETRLHGSAYDKMVQRSGTGDTLCHQDFGEGNVIATARGVYVLDLDNVTFDFPARDLRKLINKITLDRRKWDVALLQQVLSWYSRVYPLSRDELDLLSIDLLFPHLFHDAAKNRFRKGKHTSPSRLREVIPLEEEKAKALKIVLC